MNWISQSIIYQINLRSLAVREPGNAIEAMGERRTGKSPLAYVTANLSKLKRFGVNVLYLMPPYPMGREARKGIGSPYSIRDFRAVDPEHGTLAELLKFVRRAHALGMRVILDITPNHTSRDNVWTKKHPGYYFKNADGGLRYDWDWSDTAKLNYGDPGLRRAMRDVLDFWLGCLGARNGRKEGGQAAAPPGRGRAVLDGVDGFRFDMAHIISDLSFWNEALAYLKEKHAPRELLFMAESYGARNNLDLFGRGMNAAYDDDLYKVCQYLYAVDGRGETVVNLAPEAAHNGDFAGILARFRTNGIAGAVEEALGQYERVLGRGFDEEGDPVRRGSGVAELRPPEVEGGGSGGFDKQNPPGDTGGPWLARYTDNHDEGRGIWRFGAGGTRAMMQLVFMTGHTLPFLLTGQEFGAANRPPIHERMGLCDKGPRVVTGDVVKARDGIEFEGNLFVRGMQERQAFFSFYKKLIALRRGQAALTAGSFELLEAGEEGAREARTVIAFARGLGGKNLHVAVNLGPAPRKLQQAGLFAGRKVYGQLKNGVLAPFAAVVARG